MATVEYKWRGGLCIEVSPVPNTVVIFGAKGDLAARKLYPALFNLHKRGLFHDKSAIVACARKGDDNDEAFRNEIGALIKASLPSVDEDILNAFLTKLYFHKGDYSDISTYRTLSDKLDKIEHEKNNHYSARVFYLSTGSNMYSKIVDMLAEASLTAICAEDSLRPCPHVVLEKPFGRDLESARKLDNELRRTLGEKQIYRIDHYLGKETVQNILMTRFANIVFEPVWNSTYIDSVQITAAETVGVEHRAGYFEQSGLLRDMFQNHMLEMLSLVAMEMPPSFDADSVRDEKIKLLKSIRPFDLKKLDRQIIRGQYGAGNLNGVNVPAYVSEPGVAPNSQTETFVAAKVMIDNWRWKGVPFYLRSGKRLPVKRSEIVIRFKHIPHSIFAPLSEVDLAANELILSVQPQEGLTLSILAKQPGPKLCMGNLSMDFKYSSILERGETMPDAYERLLLDCMLGDQTLFIRSDTIELAWQLLTPVLNAWESNAPNSGELHTYPAGSWGPKASDKLIQDDDRFWRQA